MVTDSRALVLGGGGAVGVGWQTGLLTGLREAGVDMTGAETVVGTSAGALVGALLASGRDVTDALTALAALGQSIDSDGLAEGSEGFLSARRHASRDIHPQQALRAIGHEAREADTLDEDAYLSLFGVLDDAAWPTGFRCTAIDTDTGDLVVWNQESGVPLLNAVASSCVVPGLFPTVTVNGRRYMDGGILDHLNMTAAPPARLLVVLSCHPLGPGRARTDNGLATSFAAIQGELAQARATGQLVAIEPDFGETQEPANRMNPNLAVQAFHIGKRQARGEAATIQATWTL